MSWWPTFSLVLSQACRLRCRRGAFALCIIFTHGTKIPHDSSGTMTVPNRGHDSVEDIESLDRPPSANLPPLKVYHPLSFHVLALLAAASVLGVLARLGILALATYDGHSIFPLAYVQAIGCLIMGFGVALKEPLGKLCGPQTCHYPILIVQFVPSKVTVPCTLQ
jgi:hypothetical protein